MDAPDLETITIEPERTARASVIWLHGLGADGNDFVPIVPELGLAPELGVRFLFPHAPQRPVTLNGGMRMRAWFDLYGLSRDSGEDARGISDSQAAVERLIEHETRAGIPARRIVLAGFSQGGAVALHTGLRHRERLAGLLALSTWLPLADRVAGEAAEDNRGLPIFMAHGSEDPMVDPRHGEASARQLRALGYALTWRTYPMQHQVCLEQIRDVGDWLSQVLARTEPA